MWQLSLYEYLYNAQNKTKLLIPHLDKENKLRVIGLTDKRTPREEIFKFMEAVKPGFMYMPTKHKLTEINQKR
ncbi:hypothetical protein AGMMS49592_6060 [Endomicrobiia bacterium]|nr:hypothetical protein AGMMS49592_6060 [Endomicrobiia bacterium]